MDATAPPSTPTLSLFSLPTKPPPPDHSGMLTPPLQPRVSVPFFWEVAPGKPRASTSPTKAVSRCLDLPPRLLPDVKTVDRITGVSETFVVPRCASHSTVFARERLPGSFEEMGFVGKRRESKGRGYLGGWRRKGSKRSTRVCEGSSVNSPCVSSVVGECEVDGKMRRSGFRRSGRLFSLSGSRAQTHDWASKILGSFKQVVPLQWRNTKVSRKDFSL